jgi:protein SCO1/2
MIVVSSLLIAACGGSSDFKGDFAGVDLAIPLEKPDVVLTDTAGNRFDLRAATEGQLTLVYFGYTNCPDICPIHLAQLTQVLERPEMPDNVAVVFITVDPERDDATSIRRFLNNYRDGIVGLRGTQDEIDAAQVLFDVPLAQREGDGDDYIFGHAGQVFAFAPDGYAYSVYPQGTRQTHWVRDLPVINTINGVGVEAAEEQSLSERVGKI